MKYASYLAILYYAAIAAFSVFWMINAITAKPALPCTVAEISPDFSPEDREKCRILRTRKL
jgi:hypothetical protein